MATQATVSTITGPVKTERILTDLTSTPTREPGELDVLVDFIIGSPFAPVLPIGVGRVVFGAAQRNDARERDFTDLLLASLQGSDLDAIRIQQRLDATGKGNIPLDIQARQAKERAILQAIPLSLALKTAEVELEQLELERERALFPVIVALKQSAVEQGRALEEKRRAETFSLLSLVDVEGEKRAAGVEKTLAEAAQLRQNTRLVDIALAGLDFFGKAIFLRDRLFPPVPEPAERPRVVGRPGRVSRVITSF